MVLHGIERAVRSAEKFLGRVAILRECRDARANRKRRALRFSGETLADSRDDARGDVLPASGSTSANSSPPYRAAVSIAREWLRRILAIRTSARLPVRCPY